MKCQVCGKKFDVLWPNQWAYKDGKKFLCSYGCMRRMERGEKDMEKFTKEQRQEAIRIALDGGDVKAYLKSIGSTSPENLWYYMKTQLRKKDPETWEKLAKVDGRKKKPEKPTEAPTVKLDGPIRIETPEKNKVEVIETPEKQIGGLYPPPEGKKAYERRYTAVETSAGDFQFFRKQGYLDWTPLDGNGTVSMSIEEWREFFRVFPLMAADLGVEL